MSEERTRVLKLLEEGKISADQAARLIEALGSRRSDDECGFPPMPPVPPVAPLRRMHLRGRAMADIDRIPDIVARAVSSAVRSSRDERGSSRLFETGTSLNVKTVSGDIEVAGTSEKGISLTFEGSPSARETDGAVEISAVSDDVGARTPRTCDVGIKTVSGDVTAAQLSGTLGITTVSGDAEAVEVEGTLIVVTVSGDVELTRVSGDIAVETRSGDVDIVPDKLFSGTAVTKSGDVTLLVRPGADVTLELVTEDGDIDVDLDAGHEVLEDSEAVKRIRVGAGTRTFRVKTTSGDITVRDESEE